MSPEQRIKASFATDSPYQPLAPAGLQPYPFQRAGVEFALQAIEQWGACLVADDMGLGKTIQGLCIANALGVERVLIVCPASLRINWQREAAKWLLWAHVSVISYEGAAKEYDPSDRPTAPVVWPLVIYDEAQYMKNPAAKRTLACLEIPARKRVFLSGTPVTNRPIELWPILRGIDPKAWGSRHDFGVRYCAAKMQRMKVRTKHGAKWTNVWDYSGASNLVELQRRLRSTVMVRRLKKDVLKDLPPKVRQIIEIPAKGQSIPADLLRAIGVIAKLRHKAHTPDEVRQLKEAQAVALERMSKVRHEQALAKVPAVVEHVRELLESVDKVVVFAHHRDVIAQLHDALTDFRPSLVVGGQGDLIKQKNVDEFQTVPECRVFIGQIQAAGVGLTLTAASTVVFAELDWTPGNMAQCEDRCHRIGQKDSVLVQHLVLEGSLDARISKALLRKQQVIDQTLDSGAVSAELDWVEALATPED